MINEENIFIGTKSLLDLLEKKETQQAINKTIDEQLYNLINYFTHKGYRVDSIYGFEKDSVLKDEDISVYHYFRDVFFLNYGILNDWNKFDTNEKIYYNSLKNDFLEIYDSKPFPTDNIDLKNII